MEKLSNNAIFSIKLLFFLFILGLSVGCKSQIEVKTSVWSPMSSYEKVENDTIMTLVFEENFNDSISIYKGNTHLKDFTIKTNKSLGVVPIFYKIQKSDEADQKIKVIFIEKEKEIIFDLKDYSYVYISRENNGKLYYIEYSNFKRKYY